MNILADYHHAGLYHSLYMLFEERLGLNLFRPIGMEWANKGYWRYYPHPETQKQFLGLHQTSLKPKSQLNKDRRIEDGVYYIWEPSEHFEHRAITLDKFKEMDIDILLASVPQHLSTFAELIANFKPDAKLVFQMGNEFPTYDWGLVRNLMSSTAPFEVPDDVNSVFYHQEFDLDVFKYTPPKQTGKIKTYLNWHQKSSDYTLWEMYKNLMPEFEFIEHGAGGVDGVISGTENIAASMADADLVWHCKPGGDGYGHIIHNAYACGRPVIGRFNHYKGQLADVLLEDGVTGIDLDSHTPQEIVGKVKSLYTGGALLSMSKNARKVFDENVGFDKEVSEIKVFLSNLQ